jgi:hypothetical protein
VTGCQHLDTWFDRTLCACAAPDDYNGVMHTICVDCGAILGPDGARHQAYLDSIPDTLLMDTPDDQERLALAVHAVGRAWYRESGEIEDRHIESNSDQLAAEIMRALRAAETI